MSIERIEQLSQQAAQIDGDIRSIQAAIAAESRTATADELAKIKACNEQFDLLQAEIELLKRDENRENALGKPLARTVAPPPNPGATTFTAPPASGTMTITGGTPAAWNYDNHGFKQGFGEFLCAVRNSSVFNKTDPRLMVNAITTFGGETVGADGGFALPPQFAQGIWSQVMAQDSFLTAMQPVQTNSNLLVVPTDEDAPWHTSAVTAAKYAEGGSLTASKPVIKKVNVVVHNVGSLVHVSNQSLSDIPFLASYVQRKMAEKIRWQMENYVINGTGMDQPTGILNAPGLLALADDSFSNATTIAVETIFTMAASRLAGSGYFFVMHPLIQPQIWALKTGTTGYPLYTFDAKGAPGGALLGLPVYVSEACKPLNTQGDIILASPDGYVMALNGGVNTASTIAFAFDQDMQSFRATVRMGGEPTLSAKVLRNDATNYASNLIALQARS